MQMSKDVCDFNETTKINARNPIDEILDDCAKDVLADPLLFKNVVYAEAGNDEVKWSSGLQ